MSNIYIKEPPTFGKVLVTTSIGELDVELWSKEAPIACRNFIQLCMEGYYDNVIFHRIIKGFMVQGGDPSGTGEGGESVYGKPFKDEFHQRLRFVRRGLVAMANSGQDDNGSQFFITLGPCNDLNKKHTIFAKIAGDTIYNLVQLGDVDTDPSNDRPIVPPVIKSTKVLANPFDDIEPRVKKEKKKKSKKKKERAVKAVKDFGLLSFGDEAFEEEEKNTDFDAKGPNKGKSSHDIGDDPKLISKTIEDCSDEEPEVKKSKLEVIKSKLKSSSASKQPSEAVVREASKEDELEAIKKESRRVAKEILKSKKDKSKTETKDDKSIAEIPEENEPEPNTVYANYKKQKKEIKKKAKESKMSKKDNEKLLMAYFDSFSKQLEQVKQNDDEDQEKDDKTKADPKIAWMGKIFKSEEDELRDAKDMNRDINEDRYDVYDPRNPLNKRKREKSKKSNHRRERR